MGAQKRIALYGGTFDPVHTGHVEIARRVSELFEIEKLLFIPAQMAPHKIGRPVTEPIHRYAMLALATQNDPKLSISTFELDAPDRRYTVDTIAYFQRLFGNACEIFFIMGADSWSEITAWREWERLSDDDESHRRHAPGLRTISDACRCDWRANRRLEIEQRGIATRREFSLLTWCSTMFRQRTSGGSRVKDERKSWNDLFLVQCWNTSRSMGFIEN